MSMCGCFLCLYPCLLMEANGIYGLLSSASQINVTLSNLSKPHLTDHPTTPSWVAMVSDEIIHQCWIFNIIFGQKSVKGFNIAVSCRACLLAIKLLFRNKMLHVKPEETSVLPIIKHSLIVMSVDYGGLHCLFLFLGVFSFIGQFTICGKGNQRVIKCQKQ